MNNIENIDNYSKIMELRISLNAPLFEDRGIHPSFISLIDELWLLIDNEDAILVNNGEKSYHAKLIENITVDNDIIGSIGRLIVAWPQQASKFRLPTPRALTANEKLKNVEIVIGLDRYDKHQFKMELMEELQHVLRYHSFMIKDFHSDAVQQELNRYKFYGDVIQSFQQDKQTTWDRFFLTAYYLSDIDEINAKTTQLYHLIKDDDSINRTNFKDVIATTDLGESVTHLQTCLSLINKLVDTNLGERLSKIITEYAHLSANESLTNFKHRIISGIIKLQKQMYKVANKALYDAETANPNRKIQMHEEASRELISQFKNIDIIQEFHKAQEKQRLYEEKILRIKELMQIE